MLRRDFLDLFLKSAGCFTLAAASTPFVSRLGAADAAAGRYAFPQGVASGDPTPGGVMLWTRVTGAEGDSAVIPLVTQISTTPDFAEVIAERSITATPESDHTVRILVSDLEPDTIYYYRFRAGADVSAPLGRTRTAPLPDADRSVRLAFASCQSYEGGYYHAWRTLINEDTAAAADQQIDFVLHLGDFIYEALGYGTARAIAGFPSGGGHSPGFGEKGYAVTVEDYRFLYKTYLEDPDLREARARWPFICTWDDHEFSDDCWQSASTYQPRPTAEQRRKIAANRAWFEFIPAQLSDHPGTGGIPNQAHDFSPTTVSNTPLSGEVDDHGLDQDANNLKAIGSLSIYRAFRFGRHVELVVTDTRSHRSEHPVPGELNVQISGSPRYVTPIDLVRLCDAGRTFAGGNPPAEIPLGDTTIPNPRRHSPPGTMLGAAQKAWFKQVLSNSDATWKVWANSLPLLPLRLDLDQIDPNARELAFTIDSWDGYPSERAELLGFVAEEQIPNFVSLTGDHHAHFAGAIAPDFDTAEDPDWVGAEFAVAGISSQSVYEGVLAYTPEDSPLRPLTTYADHAGKPTDNLNTTFLWGSKAAMTAAKTGNLEQAQAARNPRHNRHLAYCDTHSYGIAVAHYSAGETQVRLIGIQKPDTPRGKAGGEIERQTTFSLPAWKAGSPAPKLAPPRIEGNKPFPLA